mgnify:CR=1 FL=1
MRQDNELVTPKLNELTIYQTVEFATRLRELVKNINEPLLKRARATQKHNVENLGFYADLMPYLAVLNQCAFLP